MRTHLCDEETWSSFPDSQFTTTEQVATNVLRLVEDESLTGKVLEISKGNWYYRDPAEFCDQAQEKIMGAAGESF